MPLISGIFEKYYYSVSAFNALQAFTLLGARLYVAWVFFAAGLTKLNDWETTLFLFEEEYSVPLISFELAAYLGTAGEIILPLLLAIGLLTRFSAIGLSIVNIVAVYSLEEIAPAAFYLHVIWGILLLQLIIFSGNKISFDYLIKRSLTKNV